MGGHRFLNKSSQGVLEKVPLQKAAGQTVDQSEGEKAGGSGKKSGKKADCTPKKEGPGNGQKFKNRGPILPAIPPERKYDEECQLSHHSRGNVHRDIGELDPGGIRSRPFLVAAATGVQGQQPYGHRTEGQSETGAKYVIPGGIQLQRQPGRGHPPKSENVLSQTIRTGSPAGR